MSLKNGFGVEFYGYVIELKIERAVSPSIGFGFDADNTTALASVMAWRYWVGLQFSYPHAGEDFQTAVEWLGRTLGRVSRRVADLVAKAAGLRSMFSGK